METADGEKEIRQRERQLRRVRSASERDEASSEGGCCGESLDESAQPWARSLASLAHDPRAKTRISHPPPPSLPPSTRRRPSP